MTEISMMSYAELKKAMSRDMHIFVGNDGFLNGKELQKVYARKPERLFLHYTNGSHEVLDMHYECAWDFIAMILGRKGADSL